MKNEHFKPGDLLFLRAFSEELAFIYVGKTLDDRHRLVSAHDLSKYVDIKEDYLSFFIDDVVSIDVCL